MLLKTSAQTTKSFYACTTTTPSPFPKKKSYDPSTKHAVSTLYNKPSLCLMKPSISTHLVSFSPATDSYTDLTIVAVITANVRLHRQWDTSSLGSWCVLANQSLGHHAVATTTRRKRKNIQFSGQPEKNLICELFDLGIKYSVHHQRPVSGRYCCHSQLISIHFGKLLGPVLMLCSLADCQLCHSSIIILHISLFSKKKKKVEWLWYSQVEQLFTNLITVVSIECFVKFFGLWRIQLIEINVELKTRWKMVRLDLRKLKHRSPSSKSVVFKVVYFFSVSPFPA